MTEVLVSSWVTHLIIISWLCGERLTFFWTKLSTFHNNFKRCSSYLIHKETQVQRGWGRMGDWFRSPCMLLLHHCMSLLPSELRILRLPVLRRTVGMSVSFSSDFSILPLFMSVHNHARCCCAKKKKKAKIQVLKRQAWVCVCVCGWGCELAQKAKTDLPFPDLCVCMRTGLFWMWRAFSSTMMKQRCKWLLINRSFNKTMYKSQKKGGVPS